MKMTLANAANVNTLFVGAPQEDGGAGGNLFFGDPASFSPKVLEYVIRRHCVASVLDVGSGRGHLPHYLHHVHHLPVIGIEGLPYNVEHAVHPLIFHDLAAGPWRGSPVDLVTCVEVVEHIDERHMNNLLDTLTAGRLLLMTHALPGQGGVGHVNEQPAEYWITHLRSRNFGLLQLDTQIIRRLASEESHGRSWFAASGLMFGRLPGVPA